MSVCLSVCWFGCPIITLEPMNWFHSNLNWGVFLAWFENFKLSGLTFKGNTVTLWQLSVLLNIVETSWHTFWTQCIDLCNECFLWTYSLNSPLIKRGLVLRWGSPYVYALSEKGIRLGKYLEEAYGIPERGGPGAAYFPYCQALGFF